MIFALDNSTWTYLLLAIGIGLLAGLLISKRGKVDKSKIATLKKDEFYETMRKGTLIDVRKKDAYENGKILGSRNYPGKSGAKNAAVRKDLPIFIYDDRGTGSAYQIAKAYVKAGAVMVYILSGGYLGTHK